VLASSGAFRRAAGTVFGLCRCDVFIIGIRSKIGSRLLEADQGLCSICENSARQALYAPEIVL